MNTSLVPRFLPALAVLLFSASFASASKEWEGAWHAKNGDEERVLLIVEGYWTLTNFNRANPAFQGTMGGTFEAKGPAATSTVQFDSTDATRVKSTFSVEIQREGDALLIHSGDGSVDRWERVKASEDALSGVWWISGRVTDGKIEPRPLRDRRTLKVLTGGRFQWIAINIETGEFSGSGGGRYTFKDGKYTENIEFFSRDSTRVGASLVFDGEIKEGLWHHRGLSSRGDPIYEVWSRLAAAK